MKKTIAIVLTAILAISALSIVASVSASTASAKPFMNWNDNKRTGDNDNGMGMGMFGGHGNQQPETQSFVRIDGQVKKLGISNATGTLEAQTRTVVINSTDSRQGSSATALWTTTSSPIASVRAKENFTYTFYTANLVNASIASLNVTGDSFFLNGTWNVYKVTTTYNVTTDSTGTIIGFDHDQNAAALATNAYGELKIPTGTNNFTLTIKGVDAVNGVVHAERTSSKMFNPFIVNNDTTSTTVTKADVSSVVSAYGSSPGWGNYDQRMDYNMHYRIDITDLATAAANVNSD